MENRVIEEMGADEYGEDEEIKVLREQVQDNKVMGTDEYGEDEEIKELREQGQENEEMGAYEYREDEEIKELREQVPENEEEHIKKEKIESIETNKQEWKTGIREVERSKDERTEEMRGKI